MSTKQLFYQWSSLVSGDHLAFNKLIDITHIKVRQHLVHGVFF